MTTYTQLKQDILAYNTNKAPSFEDAIPTFVRNAQEMIYKQVPRLRCFQKSVPVTVSFDAAGAQRQGFPFPDGIEVLDGITMVGRQRNTLGQRDESYIMELYEGAPFTQLAGRTDEPKYFFAVDREIFLAPISGNVSYAMQIDGHGPLEALSETNQENWLSKYAYNAMFNGAMMESCKLMRRDPVTYSVPFNIELKKLAMQVEDMTINSAENII